MNYKKISQYTRFWELDTFRGLAIILMIIYHSIFLLNYFSIYTIKFNFYNAIVLPMIVEIIFLTLVGICLYISYKRAKNILNKNQLRLKFLLRGLKIFSWGMIITIFTYLFVPQYIIVFGILQFIGVSIILGYYFINFRRLNLILALLIIIGGIVITNIKFSNDYLLIFGASTGFDTFDYFPIFPWFGLILLGIYLSNKLYKNNQRQFQLKDCSNNAIVRLLSYLGRHSLFIYLIHIPVLCTIIMLINMI